MSAMGDEDNEGFVTDEELSPAAEIKLGDTFSSWALFEEKLKLVSEATNAVFVVKNSKLIETVNLGLKKKKYNVDLKYKSAFISCKNYGDYKTKSEGIRPNQSTFKLGCEAHICIKAHLDSQVLVVEEANFNHNHILEKAIKDFFPEVRALNANELENAQKLLKLRVKPSLLLADIFKETGKNLIGQDLVNARHALLRQERGGRSESEDLLLYLQSLEQQGDHIVVGTDDSGVIQFIFIMHKNMKETFQKFPEVIIVDSTYNTNKHKMPLVFINAMNGLGGTETVAYAFIVKETTAVYTEIFTEFKKAVGVKAEEIKTVVIDRDMREISSVNDVLPNSSIHLCSFHVSSAFKRNTKDEPEKEAVREILQNMIYAKDEEQYTKLLNSLKEVATKKFFEDYFLKHWDNCQAAWSRRDKLQSASLGNDTTNRNESLNSKVKAVIDRSFNVKEAIIGVRNVLDSKQNTMAYKRYLMFAKKTYVVNCADPTVQAVLDTCTQYAAVQIRAELEAAKKPAVKIITNTTLASCTCYIAKSQLLPCRHIMRLRASEGMPMYSQELVPERWLKTYNMPPDVEKTSDDVISTGNGTLVVQKLPPVLRPKGKQEKYKSGLQLGGELAELLSVCGTREFETKCSLLKELITCWKTGEEVFLVKKGPESGSTEKEGSESSQGEDQHAGTSGLSEGDSENPDDDNFQEENNQSNEVKRIPSSARLPPPVSAAGRPKEKKYTAIGTLRKTPAVFGPGGATPLPSITLPPAVKIRGKPKDCDRTVFTNKPKRTNPKSGSKRHNKKTRNHHETNTDTDSDDVGSDSAESDEISGRRPDKNKKKNILDTDTESDDESVTDKRPVFLNENIHSMETDLVVESEIPRRETTNNSSNLNYSRLLEDSDEEILTCFDMESSLALAKDNLESTSVFPSKPQSSSESLEVTPLCRCFPQKPTVRRVAGPQSKIPGRHYYVCATKTCTFWRLTSTPQKVQKTSKQLSATVDQPTLPSLAKHLGLGKKSIESSRTAGTTNYVTKKVGRQQRAVNIPDQDITFNSGDRTYNVVSQTDSKRSYTVTADSCTCPDKMLRKVLECKHILKIKSLPQDGLQEVQSFTNRQVETSIAIIEPDPTAWCTCHKGEPSHSCIKCMKKVHAIPPCSQAPEGQEEGYGKGRVCKTCYAASQTKKIDQNGPKRKALDDLNAIDADIDVPLSQTTRSGRTVIKKKMYTPTK